MKQIRIRQTVVLLTAVTVLCLSGCRSKELKECQEHNNLLSQQVAELEYQLSLADQAALNQAPVATMSAAEGTYVIAAGDSLWSIAKNQLGDGKRYKEILAMNPQIDAGALKIGTTLRMPPQ